MRAPPAVAGVVLHRVDVGVDPQEPRRRRRERPVHDERDECRQHDAGPGRPVEVGPLARHQDQHGRRDEVVQAGVPEAERHRDPDAGVDPVVDLWLERQGEEPLDGHQVMREGVGLVQVLAAHVAGQGVEPVEAAEQRDLGDDEAPAAARTQRTADCRCSAAMANSLSHGSAARVSLCSARSDLNGRQLQRYRSAGTFLMCLASDGIEVTRSADTRLRLRIQPLQRPGEHLGLIPEVGVAAARADVRPSAGLHPQQASGRPRRVARRAALRPTSPARST